MSTTDNNSMTTYEPMLASFSEFIDCDNAVTQLKLNLVDYKIDYETNTLKINYQGFENDDIMMYEIIINKFMKKYPNYSKLWSN